MTRTIALFICAGFLLGTTGLAAAQTPAPTTPAPAPATPAPAPATPAPAPAQGKGPEEKAKKATVANDKRLATCTQKAGTDEAKKATCQKQHDAAQAKIEATEKKAMDKMKK
jgi:hypothetical protein